MHNPIRHSMKLSSALFLAGLLARSCVLDAATPPAEKLLPADTLGFVTVPAWDAADAVCKQAAFGQFWADPAMRPFREHLMKRFRSDLVEPMEKDLGINLTNFTGLFHGQVTLAFLPTPPDAKPGDDSAFLFIADAGRQSSALTTNLDRLRQKWTDHGQQFKRTPIRGLDFTTLIFEAGKLSKTLDRALPGSETEKKKSEGNETKAEKTKAQLTVGQSGSLLLVSDSPKTIEKLLILQSGGSLAALADQASYGADAPAFRQATCFGWFNIKGVIDLIEKAAAGSGEEGSAPNSFSISQLLGPLGLTGLQTVGFQVQENAAGTAMTIRGKVPAEGRQGLFKILHFESKDAGPPSFVPADVVKFTRIRLDLAKAWKDLEATLAEVSPPAANFLKFVISNAGKAENPNFDLRESVLNKLGDDLISYQKAPRSSSLTDYESPPSLLLVGAQDADQVAASFKAVTSVLPPQFTTFKEREFLGRTVYSFTFSPPAGAGVQAVPASLTYAASGGYIAFSSDPGLVEEFLRSNSGDVRALRSRSGLTGAAEKVGGMNTGFFSYENTEESARAFFEAARNQSFNAAALLKSSSLGSRLGMGQPGGVTTWMDFSLLPPFERIAQVLLFRRRSHPACGRRLHVPILRAALSEVAEVAPRIGFGHEPHPSLARASRQPNRGRRSDRAPGQCREGTGRECARCAGGTRHGGNSRRRTQPDSRDRRRPGHEPGRRLALSRTPRHQQNPKGGRLGRHSRRWAFAAKRFRALPASAASA